MAVIILNKDGKDDERSVFLQSLLDKQSPIDGVKVLNHNWEQVVMDWNDFFIFIIMIMIFFYLIYVAQQSSLILKLKMFFPTDAQRLPGPGMPILHQDDSRDEYQLHRREERQRRH